jgi:undecaprenyl-diphosphatase
VLFPIVAATMAMTTPPHGRRRALLAIATLGSIALYDVIKAVVARPRPQVGHLVITATGFSFPSGHATQSAAAYGAIALVVRARYGARTGRWAVGLAVVVTATVGLSRVYLGVHWPSDVVAGWLLGTAWLWCCATTLTALLGAPNT